MLDHLGHRDLHDRIVGAIERVVASGKDRTPDLPIPPPPQIADLTAGVTVGLVALPLAMAFAISSGLTPQAGIYTAIVAGAIMSAFGGSRVQIGGPTGAFVVIVAGIVATHGVDGLFMCTMMAGVLLVALGVTGMGPRCGSFRGPSSSGSPTASRC